MNRAGDPPIREKTPRTMPRKILAVAARARGRRGQKRWPHFPSCTGVGREIVWASEPRPESEEPRSMDSVDRGLQVDHRSREPGDALMDELAHRLDSVPAEVAALVERFGVNSNADQELIRYARRLHNRLEGGVRTIAESSRIDGSVNSAGNVPFWVAGTLSTPSRRWRSASRSTASTSPLSSH